MKAKRFLAVLLTVVMLIGMLPAMSLTAFAYSGSGTEDDPYIVTDYEELRSVMLNAPENFKTRYIKLGADVSNDKNEDGIGLLLTYGQCVDLDLNGYDISRIGISNDNIFSAMNGAKLTIRDSVGDGTVISKLSGDRMTAVLYCYRNGEIIVEGGTFKSSYGTAVLVEGYVTINGGTFIANKEHTIIVNDPDYGLLSMNGGHVSNNGYNNYSIFLSVECKAKLCALTADAKIYSYSSTNFHNFIPESSALTKGYFEYNYSILPDEKTGLIEIVKSSTVFIDAASVTVTDPKSGQAPDMEINNITVGGSTYTVDKITWYNGGTVDNPGTKMTSNDKFEGGQTYIVDVHVQPTGDYVIQNGCTVTINGVSTDKVFYRDGITGAGNYRVALTAQSAVNITSMGADVTGFELLNSYFDVEATPLDSSKYTIRDITWSDCHLTDDSPIITDSSMFEAGETWQLKLWFKPAAGYAISNPATLPVTIAGQTATYVGTDGNYYCYKIEKTFSKYLHDYIDLSMDAPTSGMTPAEYAETIKIKNNDRFPYNNFEIGEVQCYRTDWNDFSTFAGGTTYYVYVEIDLKDDTSFEFAHHDSDITALLNGTPVEEYVVVDADSTWESNFNTSGGVRLSYGVYFTAKGEPTGVTVSGTATSFGSDTDDVTIELYAEGSATADYTVTVKGNSANYSIAGVLPGTYTMKVMKQNHVTREYTVTVGSSNVVQDVKIYLLGDVTGDGGGTSVKYNDDGKVVISAPKPGNYKIIIASYSGLSLLKVQFADITLESGVDSYEITDLNGFDTTGADTVKVFFWDTEMRPQCDAAVKSKQKQRTHTTDTLACVRRTGGIAH